jgi:AcrR family transcriptional regulator
MDEREQLAVWSRPERGSRGPAPERSRAQITTAAVELADAGGLAAVSMRQVATRLGTGPASLYRYVASRDDLLDLMTDSVAGEIDLTVPGSGDWLADLVALAGRAKAVHLRHPWLPDAQAGRTVLGPRAVDYLEYVLGLLAPSPASDRDKLEAIGILTALVTDFARMEIGLRQAGDSFRARQAAQTRFLVTAAADGAHPRLLAAMTAAAGAPEAGDPDDAVFGRVVRGVLRGLLG